MLNLPCFINGKFASTVNINKMITKPTVFITGAGASTDFGFPTGSRLVELMIKNLAHNTGHIQNLKSNKFDWDRSEILGFIQTVPKSNTPSIDDWIKFNPEYRDLARFSIAFTLLRLEQSNIIYETSNSYLRQIWYKMIYEVDRPSDFFKNKISFITFNYDRSIEEFFLISLKNYFGNSITENELLQMYNSIPIHHVYGGIPYDLNTSNVHTYYSMYGNGVRLEENDIYKVFKISENISVIHDETLFIDDTIKKIISEARSIIFLGFGYNMESVGKLKLSETNADCDIISSKIGLSHSIQQRVLNYFRGKGYSFGFVEGSMNEIIDLYMINDPI